MRDTSISRPAPLARNSFKGDEIASVTPEQKKFCTDLYNSQGGMHNDGPFTPYGLKPSIVFPGTLGGGNWGGVSFDPKLSYIFVNTMDLGGIGWMVKQPEGSPRGPYEKTSQMGPMGRFWNPDNRWPCQQPPWGRLSAVNANTGEIVWQVPLGVVDELEAIGVHNTGALNIGGSIATAGGLVFIGATMDSRFRAFDSRTRRQLWVTKIDATARTTPITFMGRDGRQYVVVTAGGGDTLDDTVSDSIMAFALPD